MNVLMGGALLLVILAFAPSILRRIRSLRDIFWAGVIVGGTVMLALGLLREGLEQMGWMT